MEENFKEIKNAEKVLIRGNEIIILGCPEEDDENHNCDVMGCGQWCVLFRGWLRAKEIGVTLHERK